jgi:hypothetical protein
MVDVLLFSDSIDVIGGPQRVDVDIDIGSVGQRGSNIFVGSGNPNLPTAVLPEEPKTYDMYINLSPNDVEYLFLYQYLNYDGNLTWVRLLRLIPNTFLENKLINFVDGAAVYNVPVITVIPLASVGLYEPENFNIQHRVINDRPVASATSVAGAFEIDDNDQLVLPITITAVEIDPQTGAWTPVSGERFVHLIMTVI